MKKADPKLEILVEEQELVIEQLAGGGFNPERVRLLVYGESGVGKTRFAATWPSVLLEGQAGRAGRGAGCRAGRRQRD